MLLRTNALLKALIWMNKWDRLRYNIFQDFLENLCFIKNVINFVCCQVRESVWQVLKGIWKVLGTQFGYVRLDFSAPTSLRVSANLDVKLKSAVRKK